MLSVVTLTGLTHAHVKLDTLEMADLAAVSCQIETDLFTEPFKNIGTLKQSSTAKRVSL